MKSWYYEDFVREENPALPSHSLKHFTFIFFHHCPLLMQFSSNQEKVFSDFLEYKVRVPVCGAIILNHQMDQVLLVRGYFFIKFNNADGKLKVLGLFQKEKLIKMNLKKIVLFEKYWKKRVLISHRL